ncbi:protein-tyrosine phosphatase [Geodermatophilus pulveris]|uniref:Protein-tyrosine phosphatase n=1 Tax=Geodermatophilus pulveris TaxID=1564159 RepID=A0A239GWR0_9ACTN|nr:low molecular weight phosphatase family protein [Geodermatophilus pulveris]SNS73305.1 protein-tyrosine phosphatase [Geodermatophilus pulveris]
MTGPGAPGDGPPFVVLAVCTGNVCRSPVAELLLRAGLGTGSGVEVTSAGLDALTGRPVDPAMARRLAARGVDPHGFTARQLDPAGVRRADLVLTATATQRRSVVALVPAAVRRTSTLLEFAAVAGLVDPAALPERPGNRLAALVGAAPRARALRTGPAADDVEDPYRRPEDAFDRAFTAIDDAVGRLLAVLRPHPAPAGAGRPVRVTTGGALR